MKVAHVARRLAERLKSTKAEPSYSDLPQVAAIDEDAVEACALAHDLGHPPFGHVAERRLDDLAKDYGGFEGNAQSFRIVTKLAAGPGGENRYRGLNLTRGTLNGLLKYPWERSGSGAQQVKFGAYNCDHEAFEWTRRGWPKGCTGDMAQTRQQRSLEAELMDWADDVTYAVHDLEDFYRSGLIPFGVLAGSQAEETRFAASFDATTDRGKRIRSLPGLTEVILGEALGYVVSYVAAQLRQPFDGTLLARAKLREIASELIGRFMSSIDPRRSPSDSDPRLVEIDSRDRALVEVLQQLTWYYVIERPALASLQAGQLKVIENLFDYYFASIAKRPRRRSLPQAQQIALEEAEDESGRVRVIVDYIAGMTDARALALNGRLLGLSPGSLLDPIAN